ncbi:MAG: Fe-S cluster assembly protein NifU [Candidatus Omnitrophica bacterium]|nr:Fe-S cluster assembly protein NifU [Candidatus Omnitrophota bacterium]
MWNYTQKVKEYFLNPHNVGEVENPDAVGEIGNIACGDALYLTLKIDKKEDRIIEAKFKTFGCASAIASSSVLTDMVKGLTLDEALKISNKDIANVLGGLPEEKMHCSVMGQEALEKAIKGYRGIAPEKEEVLDGNIVCRCFSVTDKKIRRVVMENNLKTVDDVTHYCKAGGACGSCHEAIGKIIQEVYQVKDEKREEQKALKEKKKVLTNIEKMQLIQATIQKEIKPYLHHDGGDIDLIDIDGNKVYVTMKGACASCPASAGTLKHYVEKKLRERVSEEIEVIEKDT